ncbi:phospholipid-translocating P-type ATPase [Microstroma glucosiphilum]|uniref:Phospholipid-transporting ATPase n=1 Tax=Pseudomicrostroma glucosiphilum TaxID=1684307 RepID=A0A316U9K0_9BASI|nr:phospholipid-translocating P-type ATPase [Pseudomicrostroma glucosiphilum]PWN21083.1 phospholipid-translocating P-type ATPase [Pseudomicrostroma glucosiphilum]
MILYEQFKFFFNLYFLLVALSQFIPPLKIGFLATYIAPLSFVLLVTIGKEAIDDFERFKRDNESNSAPYEVLLKGPETSLSAARGGYDEERAWQTSSSHRVTTPSSKIRVGDLVVLHKNQRVPADLVLLKTWAGEQLPHRQTETSDGSNADTSCDDRFVLDDGEDEEEDNMTGVKQPSLDAVEKSEDPSESGTCFVRTDQLDGETDWKLRVAIDSTQRMSVANLAALTQERERATIYAGPPIKDIHTFVGTFTLNPSTDAIRSLTPPGDAAVGNLLGNDFAIAARDSEGTQEHIGMLPQPQTTPITAENLLWANTVLAAGSAIGMAVYTGTETRAVMNTSHPSTKVGLLDLEINRLSKILCGVTFTLSVGLVALNGFRGTWYVYIFRFLILFSSIIPISLRVNLDMGKTVYARQIQSDDEIPGTIVRTSTLPEELGRIEYLLSDKTGTLTQNEMELKKLHLGTMSYGWDSMDEVSHQLRTALADRPSNGESMSLNSPSSQKGTSASFTSTWGGRRDMSSRVKDVVFALALCHNVTPVINDDGSTTYQASSPDEVAIVQWTESVGLSLVDRTRTAMTVRMTGAVRSTFTFDILEIFPFTSDSKRMGIVLRDRTTGDVTFYQKGADVVMAKIVAQNDWLEEECGNMAREGLRTLVVGRKRLTEQSWTAFQTAYKAARVKISEDRNAYIQSVVEAHLERDLELLGVTGVEDKLQDDVKPTLELLRNAGIKVWMLTGDKIETATCIAISSKLVSRGQYIHQVAKVKKGEGVRDLLDFLKSKLDCCLVIDGESLSTCMELYRDEFIGLATQLSAVAACRCSPTQKADVARLIRSYTKKRVCCIGDGGNDVSMILAADVGLGIVGKEGMQASLAADFSVTQFSHLTKLLVWHGRNSYKRSAKLAQFVIHRGLIISIIQAVFSSIFYFAPIALYQGWLMVGYATLYTMAPVFSLVLDKDVSEDLALLYPELYRDLTKGRSLTAKTFAEWFAISIYQGGAIMILSLLLFENEFLNIIAISFTALVLNELIMVALEITTWHVYMVLSEVVTLLLYCISMAFLPEYFDLSFVLTTRFLWKLAVIVAVSSFPLYVIKILKRLLAPPSYSKLAVS